MSDYFLGEIRLFTLNFAPEGWLNCDGQILQISQNQALYSLLGTTYGGDGKTTFALPDLRGRVPVSLGTTQPYAGYTLGGKGGADGVILTTANLPAHTHYVAVETAVGTNVDPTGGYFAAAGPGDDGAGGSGPAPNIYGPVTFTSPATAVALNAGVVGIAGGGAAHSNLQPYLALRFCISTVGDYPSFE